MKPTTHIRRAPFDALTACGLPVHGVRVVPERPTCKRCRKARKVKR